MYMTLINGYQAAAILRSIGDSLYADAVKKEIFTYKQSLGSDDSPYKDLQHTVSGQVDLLVNKLCYLEEPIDAQKLGSVHRLLIAQPIAVQTFFFDRLFWAAERFFESGPEFVNGMHTEIQILYYGLIYLWGTREEKQQ